MSFITSGSTVNLEIQDANTNIIMGGANAGGSITSGSNNIGLGDNVFTSLTTGSGNVSIGKRSSNALIGGGSHVAVGYLPHYLTVCCVERFYRGIFQRKLLQVPIIHW